MLRVTAVLFVWGNKNFETGGLTNGEMDWAVQLHLQTFVSTRAERYVQKNFHSLRKFISWQDMFYEVVFIKVVLLQKI